MKTKEERSWKKGIIAKKRDKVITSLLMVVVGILLLIWPGQALNVICSIIGLVLCIGGIAAVVTYFVTKEKGFALTMTMAAGVIIAFLGIWIFLNPGVLAALIPAIIGAFIIISGIINLSEAVTIHRERGNGMVATLIIAAVTIVLGLIVFFRPQWTNAFLVRLIGIALIFDGCSDIWVISRISGTVKEIAADLKAPDGKAVDENGERVAAKAYAPDESAKAKAEGDKAGAKDADVKPLKSFFHRNTEKKQDVKEAEQTVFDQTEPENFTETHSYTTTTVKRPAHVHEDNEAEETVVSGEAAEETVVSGQAAAEGSVVSGEAAAAEEAAGEKKGKTEEPAAGSATTEQKE